MVENLLDNTQEIISVSEINRRAKSILEENFPLVWIQGEVSNFFSAASGHWYFSLKDESSEIRCAMFTNKNHQITFEPKDGDHLVLNGTLSIFEGRGQYQIIVEHIELAGEGALLKAFEEVQKVKGEEYPDVELSHMLADNCAMQLLRNPKQFDVIVTDNLFGDILSDEAAMLTGSIGLLPSASLGAKDKNGKIRSMYEPVHGSAPDIAGTGKANPIATILSFSMALRYTLDLDKEADNLDQAVQKVLDDGLRTKDILSKGKKEVSTSQMGDAIISKLK